MLGLLIETKDDFNLFQENFIEKITLHFCRCSAASGYRIVSVSFTMPVRPAFLSFCLSVCLSACKLGSHRTDIYEILCWEGRGKMQVFWDVTSSPFIHSFIHSFILPSALRQIHSLFQSKFSTQCDLVLPLSILSILS